MTPPPKQQQFTEVTFNQYNLFTLDSPSTMWIPSVVSLPCSLLYVKRLELYDN